MSSSGNARGKRIAVVGLLLILALLAWQGWKMFGKVLAPTPVPALPPLEQPLPIGRETPPAPPLPIETPPKTAQELPPSPVRTPKKKKISTRPAVAPSPPIPNAPQPNLPVVPLPPQTPPPPEPQEWRGNDTAVTHAGQVVIRNDHQWISFWSEHHPHEAAPDVDFTQNMVIGVFAGERPADQFSIVITNVRTLQKTLAVDFREIPPPTGTFAVGVSVYPYDIKVIPLSTLPVKFNGSVDTSGR